MLDEELHDIDENLDWESPYENEWGGVTEMGYFTLHKEVGVGNEGFEDFGKIEPRLLSNSRMKRTSKRFSGVEIHTSELIN